MTRDELFVLYVALSLLIGGCVLTYEIWHRPAMLDRADGRGKHPSPKMRGFDLVLFGVFVVVFWPCLLIAMIVDPPGTR